ncbi:MAG: hypothetical protein WD021_10065 [Rhodothermales bacterium]
MPKTIFSSLLFVLLVLLVGGCDSGDPIDEPHPRDVAGLYNFTEFTFEPSGTAFQPIIVLDTLVQSETNLRLSSGGNFILSYQFINGDVFFPAGNFAVTASTVRLNGEDTYRPQFEQLLLTDEFTLRRSVDEPGLLTASISKTINPSEFSDRYAGVTEMSGTLKLRLVKE